MIQRLYAHNFRCFENFEFKPREQRTALLIGKNGVGKSTLAAVLQVFQSLGRDTNRLGKLINARDFFLGRTLLPMRFEIEVLIDTQLYRYVLALELPERFKEVRVIEETLEVDGIALFERAKAEVTLFKNHNQQLSQFSVDWHLVALPLIQDHPGKNNLQIFKTWLANMVILAPVPSAMSGEAHLPTLQPRFDAANLADWVAGLLRLHPASYATLHQHVQQLMPDFSQLKNEDVGRDATRMQVEFVVRQESFALDFEQLSDGEKCFFLYAVVAAANRAYGPLFCFWDEPDSFLSMSEVGHFVMALRKAFNERGGQIVMTSHNEEAIRKFSVENTWVMDRKSHLEPALIRPLAELPKYDDLISALISGDVTL